MTVRKNEMKVAPPASTHLTSRLAPPNPSALPEQVRRVLEEEAQQFGTPLNTTLVWTHHPALLAAFRAWRTAIGKTALIPEDLKYLVYVRVASLNGCPF